MSLSDKKIQREVYNKYYPEEDVKEFIKKLKEELLKKNRKLHNITGYGINYEELIGKRRIGIKMSLSDKKIQREVYNKYYREEDVKEFIKKLKEFKVKCMICNQPLDAIPISEIDKLAGEELI